MRISEQDEDGSLAKCKPTGKIKNDCCATYLVGSSEYDHDGDGENSEKQKYNSITEGIRVLNVHKLWTLTNCLLH